MREESLTIGADIGGTHITVALVDLYKKTIVPHSSIRAKVDSHGSASEIIEVWCQAIERAKKDLNISKISLAIPGPFDYEKGICLIKDQGKYENLYGLNIKALLSERLQVNTEDISMINDAASFLEGEVFGGAARGFKHAIGITLGTGLGTSVYGECGATNADLWNLPFKEGIAEDYLSTRWFTNRYFDLTGVAVHDVRALVNHIETDAQVKIIFHEFGNYLADFIIHFLHKAPAQVVVLGGNISKSFIHFKGTLLKRVLTSFPDVEIKTALLGEEAALIGAASFWKHKVIGIQN